MAGEITGETDQMGFRVALLAIKSGLRSKVDGGRKTFSIRQVGATGVDAFGRQALILGLQIGGGEAQAGPATCAWAHGAEEGEGSSEHFRGVGELTGKDSGTDPTAADSFAGKNHRFGIIEQDFFFATPATEKTDITGPVFAKTPVWADGNGLQRGKRGGQLPEKIRRLLPGAGGIKWQGHGQPNLPTFQDAKLVGQSGDEKRMFFRMQDRKRVIPECQYGGVGGSVGFFPSENDATVTKVEAIKETEGKMTDGFPGGRGGGEGIDYGHVRRMREISGREMRWRAR